MKDQNPKRDPKEKIKRIIELVRFRKSLLDELSSIDNYKKKMERVRKYYNDGKS